MSIYAKSLYTIVDGTIYFDRQKDEQPQKEIDMERLRLVRKMNGEKEVVLQQFQRNQVIRSCIPAAIMGIVMDYWLLMQMILQTNKNSNAKIFIAISALFMIAANAQETVLPAKEQKACYLLKMPPYM